MKRVLYLSTFIILVYSQVFCITISPNFIENKGQIINDLGISENEILYYSSGQNNNIFIKKASVSIVTNGFNPAIQTSKSAERALFRYDIDFINSNRDLNVINDGENFEKYNFYKDKSVITDVKSYKKIILNDFYKNIDLIYYYKNDHFKYDFIIKPSATLNDIEFKINGAGKYYLSESGELVIETPLGTYSKPKPYVYQYDNNGNKISINANYEIKDGSIKFIILDNYNSYQDLIIDPDVGLVSYCGGSDIDGLYSIKQDINGDYYICGASGSYDFPATSGAIQLKPKGNSDGFIIKFDSNWKLIWSTFIGGSKDEYLMSVNIAKNYLWVSGETKSYDYPVTADAFQNSYGDGTGDIVFSKLSKDGKLLYSSYYGGDAYDSSPEAVLDSKENLWLTGRSNSTYFPLTSDAEQTQRSTMYNAFIIKFDKNEKLIYSSYFTSDIDVFGEGIACDSNDNIYITGYTVCNYLPNSNKGYQKSLSGEYDSYLAKFDNTGKNIWSSFIGGSGTDLCSNVAVDENNDVYIFGHTNSSNFPIINNKYQSKLKGSFDSFLAKFSPDSKLLWSTYHGGTGFEGFDNSILYQLAGICVKNNIITVAASTSSTNLTYTANAFQSKNNGGIDAYISQFSADKGELIYSSYFGGSGDERPYDLIIDNKGTIVNVGRTASNNLPTVKGVFQEKFGGNIDGYILGTNGNVCNKIISYDTFDNVDKLYLNGDAYYLDEYIRLTNNKINQASSVWLIDKIGSNKGFETTFSFNTSDAKDGNDYTDTPFSGADGIAFVIQNNSLLLKGSIGGSLGYQGMPNTIAIEYDLFNNGKFNDPNGNHLAVFSNGKAPNECDHKSKAMIKTVDNIIPIKNDGTIYYSKIVYDGVANTLNVFLADDPNKLINPVMEVTDFNIQKILDIKNTESVWVGFTSATGNSYQKQNLFSWNLCSYDPSTTSSIEDMPENIVTFAVFPNPVSDYLNIKLNDNFSDLIKVEIIDILGRKVYEKSLLNSELNNYIVINTKDLLPGPYYCQLTGKTSIKYLKFIKG